MIAPQENEDIIKKGEETPQNSHQSLKGKEMSIFNVFHYLGYRDDIEGGIQADSHNNQILGISHSCEKYLGIPLSAVN